MHQPDVSIHTQHLVIQCVIYVIRVEFVHKGVYICPNWLMPEVYVWHGENSFEDLSMLSDSDLRYAKA